jgi:hypothetical protein
MAVAVHAETLELQLLARRPDAAPPCARLYALNARGCSGAAHWTNVVPFSREYPPTCCQERSKQEARTHQWTA